MTYSNRLLYHCFPRLHEHEKNRVGINTRLLDEWYKDVSMAYLKSILKDGLILSTEKKAIRTSEGLLTELPTTQYVDQVRVCFTHSNIEQLNKSNHIHTDSHRGLFGDIAIGLRPSIARLFGANPCHYYHNDFYDDSENPIEKELFSAWRNENRSASGQIFSALTQVKDVLKTLSILEAIALPLYPEQDRKHYPSLDYIIKKNLKIDNWNDDIISEKKMIELLKTDTKTSEFLLRPFEFPREPMYELLLKTNILTALYQELDGTPSKFPLHYYDQVEWRIIKSENTFSVISCLNPNYETRLERTDKDKERSNEILEGFIKNIKLRYGADATVCNPSDYWIIHGIYKRNMNTAANSFDFIECIDEIVCPLCWSSEVKNILDSAWIMRRRSLDKPNIAYWEDF